jgi:hypothetical protein
MEESKQKGKNNTDYTEQGGDIVRPQTLSVNREFVFWRFVRIAFCPCNPCP